MWLKEFGYTYEMTAGGVEVMRIQNICQDLKKKKKKTIYSICKMNYATDDIWEKYMRTHTDIYYLRQVWDNGSLCYLCMPECQTLWGAKKMLGYTHR